jgi:hypothetical protein
MDHSADSLAQRLLRALVLAAAAALVAIGPLGVLADDEVELSPGGIQCVSLEVCAFADQPDKPWTEEEAVELGLAAAD